MSADNNTTIPAEIKHFAWAQLSRAAVQNEVPVEAPRYAKLIPLAPVELGPDESPDWGYWLNEFPYQAYLAWRFASTTLEPYEGWFIERTDPYNGPHVPRRDAEELIRFYDWDRRLRDQATGHEVASFALEWADEEEFEIPEFARRFLERIVRKEELPPRGQRVARFV